MGLKSVRNLWASCVILGLFGIFNASPSTAALPHGGADQAVLKDSLGFISDRIGDFMKENSVPGLSLAVTKDDRLVYSQAFGYANTSSQTKLTPDYRFRVASVSKTVTAVAIMDLVAKGFLGLNDTVLGDGAILENIFGEKPYSEAERAITIQHLLEHSSGFDDGVMGGDPTYQPRWLSQSHDELVGTVLDEYDPSAWPGTNASYSNFGYMILGRIVEKVSNIDYSISTKETVLNIVGAREMEIASDDPKHDEVVYYDQNVTAPYTFHISRRDSVGGWIARPVDLAALLTSIDALPGRTDILPEKARAQMFEPSTLKYGVAQNKTYAKGWDDVVLDKQGQLVEINKNGGFPGTTAWISIRARENVSYAVAINSAAPSAAGFKAMVDGIMADVDAWPQIDLFPDYGIHPGLATATSINSKQDPNQRKDEAQSELSTSPQEL